MLDVDAFENTAAWLEYCDGMSRFGAETEAARRQGKTRWEALNEIRKRNFEQQRDKRSQSCGDTAHDVPTVQSRQEKEARPVFERDVQAGRDSMALLALRA